MADRIIEVKKELVDMKIEAFKSLRTNLLYMDKTNVLGFTSSSANEGKTVTTFHTALSFSKLGKKVCLIDCDLRKSTLKDYIVVGGNLVGLSEFLTNQVENIHDIVYETNAENLSIVFTGKNPPNPSELLTTSKFNEFIEQLREEFDYVIIDTPPATIGPDACIVGRNCDGMLVVVRSEHAKKKVLTRVKQELERNGIRIVGAVLNGVKRYQFNREYYYYLNYEEE